MDVKFRNAKLRRLLQLMDSAGLQHNKPWFPPPKNPAASPAGEEIDVAARGHSVAGSIRPEVTSSGMSSALARQAVHDGDGRMSDPDCQVRDPGLDKNPNERGIRMGANPGGISSGSMSDGQASGGIPVDETEIFLVRLQGAMHHLKVCMMDSGLLAIRQICSSASAETLIRHSDPQYLVDILVMLQQNTCCVHLQESSAA